MAISPFALQQCLTEDLLSQGLPIEGDFWPGMTIRQAAACSIANSLLKKLSTGRTTETDQKALEKFLVCNRACEEWSLDVSKLDTKTEILLGSTRRILDDFWHKEGYPLVDSPLYVLDQCALGPGLTVGSLGNDFYTKLFSSPLSVSDLSLYRWYRRYIMRIPYWEEAEQCRISSHGDPYVVPSSRLSFVPKNDEISRCICIEPTLNGLFQLGLGRILERRLHGVFGISLQSQPFKNRALARLGSITDGLATLDLSSASDSISTKMLQYLLPSSFLYELERYRSPSVDIKGRGTVGLGMVSTMGNGYTFPLQTIIFSSVVVACMSWRGIPPNSERASELWSVFGDDIICPRACAPDVVAILQLLGFKVNHDKSFVEGPFRESCGSDFFMGSDIRGVYVKTLRTPEARFSVINLLTRFSTRTGIDLSRSIKYLLDTVPKILVPPWEDFSSGIHAPLSCVRGVFDINTQSQVYWARVPKPRLIRIKHERVVVPRGCKQRAYNPSGLLVSFLQGSVHSGAIGVREDFVRYRTKRRVAPSWGWHDVSSYESRDYGLDWERWQAVLESVLERA